MLKRPSTFVLEGLDVPIQQPGRLPIGTGPFYGRQAATGTPSRCAANSTTTRGKPLLDRVVIRPYASVRSAWAEMLRGHVDMLYEVGSTRSILSDASSESNVFTFMRHYAYVVVSEHRTAALFATAPFVAQLNAAIDREALVADALNGHGTPADGPVWPATGRTIAAFPRFRYEPTTSLTHANGPLHLRMSVRRALARAARA